MEINIYHNLKLIKGHLVIYIYTREGMYIQTIHQLSGVLGRWLIKPKEL